MIDCLYCRGTVVYGIQVQYVQFINGTALPFHLIRIRLHSMIYQVLYKYCVLVPSARRKQQHAGACSIQHGISFFFSFFPLIKSLFLSSVSE